MSTSPPGFCVGLSASPEVLVSQPVFRVFFSEEVVPYVAVGLVCSWEKVVCCGVELELSQ